MLFNYSTSRLILFHFQHFSGLEEAVFRNITACKQFADTVRTAYGPNGMNKIIINHIEKLFVTNDAATIIKELEVNFTILYLLNRIVSLFRSNIDNLN